MVQKPRIGWFVGMVLGLALLQGCGRTLSVGPTIPPTRTPSSTLTPIPSATGTATSTSTDSPMPVLTPTDTVSVPLTFTPSASETPAGIWADTPSPTSTFTSAPSMTFTPTDTDTVGSAATRTPTPIPGLCSVFGEANRNTTVYGGRYNGSRFLLGAPAVIRSISIFQYYNGCYTQLGIYADNGSGTAPATLIVRSDVGYAYGGWSRFPIPPTSLGPGNYWLTAITDGRDLAVLYTGSSSDVNFELYGGALGSFPQSLVGPYIFTGYRMTLSADDCDSVQPPTPTVTPTRTWTNTPTLTSTPIPCGYPADTCTHTKTLTPTFTRTQVPPPPATETPICTSPNAYGQSSLYPGTYGNYTSSFGGQLFFKRMIASAPGTVTNLAAMVSYTYPGSGLLQMGLYSDNGGQPDRLLTASVPVTVAPNGWRLLDVPDIAISGPATYWIAFESDDQNRASIACVCISSLRFPTGIPNPFGTLPAIAPSYSPGCFDWSVHANVCQAPGVPIDTPTLTVTPSPTPWPCDYPYACIACTPTRTPTVTGSPTSTATCTGTLTPPGSPTLTPTFTATPTLTSTPTRVSTHNIVPDCYYRYYIGGC